MRTKHVCAAAKVASGPQVSHFPFFNEVGPHLAYALSTAAVFLFMANLKDSIFSFSHNKMCGGARATCCFDVVGELRLALC
jgi:hypothetical protein